MATFGNMSPFGSSRSHSSDSESENDEGFITPDRSSMASDYVYHKTVEEKKKWDCAVTNVEEAGSASELHMDWIKKAAIAIKLLTMLIVFCVVLGAGIVSKGTLFFMLAQMKPTTKNQTTFANNGIENGTRPLEMCQVSCGGHYSLTWTCHGCGQGNNGGAGNCNGDCHWVSGQCETKTAESYFPLLSQYQSPKDGHYAGITEIGAVAWHWSVFFAFCVPQLFSFVRAARVFLMRKVDWAPWKYLAIVFVFETIHTFGLALLFFTVLPELDSVSAMMTTNAVLLIPGIFCIFRPKSKTPWKKAVCILVDILAVIFQFVGLILWPVMNSSWSDSVAAGGDEGYFWNLSKSYLLPIGLLFTSFAWWESFVDEHSFNPLSKYLWRVKINMIEEGTRYTTYLLVTIWKIILFFALFITLSSSNIGSIGNLETLFDNFKTSFYGTVNAESNSYFHYSITGDQHDYVGAIFAESFRIPLKVWAIQFTSAYVMFLFGKFACKVCIQEFSFALPMVLVLPATIGGVIGMCHARNQDPCAFLGVIPNEMFFQCPDTAQFSNWFTNYSSWYYILWYVSSIWICSHIWIPKSQRLASTEQMFGRPYYDGLILEQDILLNKRSDSGKIRFRLDVNRAPSSASNFGYDSDEENIYEDINKYQNKKNKNRKISTGQYVNDSQTLKPRDEVIRVKGCATMWHENSAEMIEMIKSIFRMDEDYVARNLARKMFKANDPDYYEWETHIFFDDAFEPDDSGKHFVANQFVKLLVKEMDEQGKRWYGARKMKVPYPAKYPTPYGGRLIWTLPGGTKVICHLKDKNKIRHKKRWSQCMYMYYFLGFQLAANDNLTEAQKELRARNTFLLALDGDVDFQPEAIIRLVDLMKRNPKVGASCGRIHPTGTGYMQWYQMFEYAVGHWFQKATEHVMGCVLCSPGCFSLFRGEALMAPNVMNTYTTSLCIFFAVSTEPRHFVQYDQGEDRWLCTLLLQQGWRVEYSAASDSFTAAPEGFKEFYNQRRRWMPSTMANIADLLGDYRRVTNNNDDISPFYIAYQILMFVSTVLGPGFIFLMISGSFAVAFPGTLTDNEAFIINLVPILIFCATCLLAKSDHQLTLAMLLSVAYAVVMVAVIVGLLVQISTMGWRSPSNLSLFFIVGCFLIAGIMHPQEIKCLPMGIIYLITIPSMYLFLVIYSIFNLNVVSWGTREVPKKKTAEELEAEKVTLEAEAKKKELESKKTFLGSLFGRDNSSLEFGMRNLFNSQAKGEGAIKQDLEQIREKLDGIEKALKKEGYSIPAKVPEEKPSSLKVPEANPKKKLSSNSVRIVEPTDLKVRDELKNPLWIEEEELGSGEVKFLKNKEITFWKELIPKYLKPLDKDKDKEKQQAAGLKELKNQMVFSFCMINAIFVVAIFLLQSQKEYISITWPYPDNAGNDQKLEPLALLFMVLFVVVQSIQMIGMFVHRAVTLGHIISTTKLAPLFKPQKKFNVNEEIDKKGVEFVKSIIKNVQPDDRDDGINIEEAVEKSMIAIASGDADELRRMSEGTALTRRGSLSGSSTAAQLKRTETMKALQRRATDYHRRKSLRPNRKSSKNKIGTINEDEDEEDEKDGNNHLKVVRTKTYEDPEHLDERDV